MLGVGDGGLDGGIEGAERLALKAFRASMATNLIASGEPLKTVLEWGEWRSRAVLRYIDENAVEAQRFLDASLVASDDDELAPEESPAKRLKGAVDFQ